MRTKEEILDNGLETSDHELQTVILEVLLDIRELLKDQQERPYKFRNVVGGGF
uniref:Uncharacterized protein n=1 Tax=viral metagenome TaxID=1070528 RepID=A0A6H2A0X3_9ZZZZ